MNAQKVFIVYERRSINVFHKRLREEVFRRGILNKRSKLLVSSRKFGSCQRSLYVNVRDLVSYIAFKRALIEASREGSKTYV